MDMREWTSLAPDILLRFAQISLRQSLMTLSASLAALSLPCCESVVYYAILDISSRTLPFVGYLDG
jgi:hypothetical protein